MCKKIPKAVSKTEIYFLRHADAVIAAGDSDEERPLSDEGRRTMQKAALGMKKLGLEFDLILTSPLLRARQTAEIVAKTLGSEPPQISQPLMSGGNPRECLRDPRLQNIRRVLLVGHAPDLGIFLGDLIGKGEIRLSKGALACVEVSSMPPEDAGKGRVWLSSNHYEEQRAPTLLWLKTAEHLGLPAG